MTGSRTRLGMLVVVVATLLGGLVAPAGALPPAGQVFIIGDSVMVGAASAVTAALPGRPVTIDARECRATVRDATYTATTGACRGTVVSGLSVLKARRAEIGDVLVVELGTNDAGSTSAFRAAVDEVMTEARGISRVIWLTIPEVRTSFVAANQVLREATSRYPNLQVADWAAIAGTAGYTVSDGLHLRAAGATAMGALVASAVGPVGRTGCVDPPSPYASQPSSASGKGYWLLDSTGKVTGYDAPFLGDLTTIGVRTKPIALASTAAGDGYWIVDSAGAVHAFGAAGTLGSVAGLRLNRPVIAMALPPDPDGYWLVAADGGVFSFGDARFLGSLGSRVLNAPIISGAASASGAGYFLIAADGGVFTFGDARFLGSLGDRPLNAPVTSMAMDPRGRGYWLYARDGGVFTFGTVAFHGSVPGLARCTPPAATVAMRPSDTGEGYWVLGDRGEVFAFGDAVHHGDRPALATGATVIDLAVRH